ncbi:MAG: zinc-binding dehydrogenase, partial [Candidatus Poribacteria bacterium]|nr:zinc-binding dehydrogenase [Candidatus Poribacteria bacterium]
AVYTHLYNLSSLCYRKAYFQPGENVAVVGLGVLGLGAVALGQVFGARVIGIGNSGIRLEMAERMGAHAVFMSDDSQLGTKLDSLTDSVGVDLVILTANPWPAFRTSLQIVRRNGRVSIVSLLGRGEPPLDFNPLAMELFYSKGISIIAVSGAAGNLYPAANQDTPYAAQDAKDRFAVDQSAGYILSLMGDGRLEPKRLVTHRFHYTEMAKAYEMIYRREKEMLGVIFEWGD